MLPICREPLGKATIQLSTMTISLTGLRLPTHVPTVAHTPKILLDIPDFQPMNLPAHLP